MIKNGQSTLENRLPRVAYLENLHTPAFMHLPRCGRPKSCRKPCGRRSILLARVYDPHRRVHLDCACRRSMSPVHMAHGVATRNSRLASSLLTAAIRHTDCFGCLPRQLPSLLIASCCMCGDFPLLDPCICLSGGCAFLKHLNLRTTDLCASKLLCTADYDAKKRGANTIAVS